MGRQDYRAQDRGDSLQCVRAISRDQGCGADKRSDSCKYREWQPDSGKCCSRGVVRMTGDRGECGWVEFTEGEGSSPELPTGKGCGGTFQGKALE